LRLRLDHVVGAGPHLPANSFRRDAQPLLLYTTIRASSRAKRSVRVTVRGQSGIAAVRIAARMISRIAAHLTAERGSAVLSSTSTGIDLPRRDDERSWVSRRDPADDLLRVRLWEPHRRSARTTAWQLASRQDYKR